MSPHALLLMFAAAGQLDQGCPSGTCAPPSLAPPPGVLVPLTDGTWAERSEDAEGVHFKISRPARPAGWKPGAWFIGRDVNHRPSYRKWEAGVERWWYPREWANLSFADEASFQAFVKERSPEKRAKDIPAYFAKGVDQPKLEQSPQRWWIGSQPFAAGNGGPDTPLPSPEAVQKSIARVESAPARRPEPAPSNRSPLLAVAIIAALGFAVYKYREG